MKGRGVMKRHDPVALAESPNGASLGGLDPAELAQVEGGEVTTAAIVGAVAIGGLAAVGVAAVGFAIGWGIAELIW